MSDLYVYVVNWRTFQHYKDRNPVWIKCYLELLADDAYMSLSGHRRAILHGLWMEYARSRLRLRAETRTLTRRLNLKVLTADLTALVQAGFIQLLDSKALSKRYQADSKADSNLLPPPARARTRSQEKEKEKEKERDTPSPASRAIRASQPGSSRKQGTNPRANGTNPRALGLSPRQLVKYTGCRITRGTHGISYKPELLGTAKPPPDWPHPRPDFETLKVALLEQALKEEPERFDEPTLDAVLGAQVKDEDERIRLGEVWAEAKGPS